MFSPAVQSTLIIYGDINGDGVVSSADARLVVSCAVGLKLTVNWRDVVCYVNKDKLVTATEAKGCASCSGSL